MKKGADLRVITKIHRIFWKGLRKAMPTRSWLYKSRYKALKAINSR
jgi:hypothetical protein